MIDDEHANSETHATYQDYLEYINKTGLPAKDWLTYDEFIGNIDDTQANIDRLKLGFIPNMNPGSIAGNIVNAANIINQGVDFAQGVGQASSQARQALKRAADAARTAGDGGNFMNVSSNFGDSGGGNRGSGGDGSVASPFDVRRLNYNAKPVEVRLNTGIVPNTYGTYYLDADAFHAPLHLTGARLSVPTTSSTDKLFTFFDNVLSFAFQNLSQANVAFNIQAYNNLSTARLVEYFNALMYALQVYYFYGSILTYCDYPHNHNQGMLALRAAMTADDLDDLYQLKRILEGTPLPPNLNNLCFYLMQNYKESSLPGAAILKIQPFGFAPPATASAPFPNLLTGQASAAISGLNTATAKNTASLIARVAPNWLVQDLLVPPEIPLHDLQFNTIFANLPCINASSSRSPSVVNLTDTITYNSYADVLDGAVFGLTTIYQSSTGWIPGLIDPVAASSTNYGGSTICNRISYAYNSTANLNGFYNTTTNRYLCFSRGETYNMDTGSNGTSYQTFGSEACLNVTTYSVRETAFKLLEWMVSLDYIKGNGNRMSSSNKPKTRSSKPKKSGRKPRFNKSRTPNDMEGKQIEG